MSNAPVDLDDARNARAAKSSKSWTGTDRIVLDDVIAEITEVYLDEVDPQNTNEPWPSPQEMKQDLLTRTNDHLEMISAGLKGQDRITRMKLLVPSQIARIMMRLHHVVSITANGLGANRDYDLIGVYVDEGIDKGLYITSETQIGAIARRYNGEITIAANKEVLAILHQNAPQVRRTTDPNLIPVENGIFDYKTKVLLPFSPEWVFLSKSITDLDPTAQSPVLTREDPVLDEDGVPVVDAAGNAVTVTSSWEVEEWLVSLAPHDPDIVKLLWQIIGAVLRPHVRWNKTAWLYSEKGNNGKGTFAEMLRNLVGEASCAVLPLANFGKDFMLEPLVNASAIIVDENDVGIYLDKVANLKAVVTNDVISINRKGKIPINFRFWGFMVQCLNEFPQVRDRSESFYRRQLFVPFEQNFKGVERRYIKDDYLQRPEVLRYVMKRALLDTPDFYVLDEPEATKVVLERYKVSNDPVREFWTEHENLYAWDLLPFAFLHDHYKAWFAKANPSGKVLGRIKFVDALLQLVEESPVWHCKDRDTAVYTGTKMSVPELLIQKYDLQDWMKQGYGGKDPRQLCSPVPAATYRGLERYAPAASTGASAPSGTGAPDTTSASGAES